MLRDVVAVLVLMVLLCTLHTDAQISSSVPQCRGVFDFYFVLDTSGSVRNHFQDEVVPFVKNVSSNFINPDFRLAFITFANTATIYLNLTTNRQDILQSVQTLERITPSGSTNLATGLIEVNKQIDQFGGDTASVVLVITDGRLGDGPAAYRQADTARNRGATIFAIGVGSASLSELRTVAGGVNKRVFFTNFTDLQTIIDQVVNDTCVEIDSATPLNVCMNQSTNIELRGRGFTNTPDNRTIACRFIIPGTRLFEITRPTEPVQYDRLVCGVPAFNQSREVLLQITLNGISYISSNVTLFVDECSPVNTGLAVGLTFTFLFLIALAVLVLLWFLFPLITGVKVTRKPPTDPEQPQGRPPKKWETVDASYYGGGGVRGIKPVTVRWGDKGATEEGDKLSKAKDANVLAVKTEAGYTPPVHNVGCWTAFKRKVLYGYIVAASYRPLRGESKFIEWQPFSETHPTTKPRSSSTGRSLVYNRTDSQSSTAPLSSNTASEIQRPIPRSTSQPRPPRPKIPENSRSATMSM